MLGGLVSAHLLATDSTDRLVQGVYKNQLLTLAEDLGNRFLPAFNTPTGLPYAWINLKVAPQAVFLFDAGCMYDRVLYIISISPKIHLDVTFVFENCLKYSIFTFQVSKIYENGLVVLFVRRIYDSASVRNSVDSMEWWRMRLRKPALQGVVRGFLLQC